MTERIHAQAEAISDQYKERLREILSEVKWYIVRDNPDGTVMIEAYVDGRPVYRFKGYYREKTGEWKIYPVRILTMGYEPLIRVRRISIYDCKRLDLVLKRGEKP